MKTILLTLLAAASLVIAADKPAKPVRLGIVAEGGKWKAFEDLKAHLATKGYPVELVTFKTYDALVDGLDGGKVDIAWNSPLSSLHYSATPIPRETALCAIKRPTRWFPLHDPKPLRLAEGTRNS